MTEEKHKRYGQPSCILKYKSNNDSSYSRQIINSGFSTSSDFGDDEGNIPFLIWVYYYFLPTRTLRMEVLFSTSSL